MQIGVRAHDYGRLPVEELAARLKEDGYDCCQLALPKAFAEIGSYADVNEEILLKIRAAFEEAHIRIAVLGCYMDLGNPDPDVRENAVATCRQALVFAKILGAGMVGTETAYPRLDKEQKKIWHPHMTDSVLRIAEEAAKLEVKFAIEPVYWHPLDSLECTEEIIRRVGDSAHLRLIFDASNLLEHPGTTNQPEYWGSWLQSIGACVDAMHIKDFYLDDRGQYVPCPLGEGVIDYSYIKDWLKTNNPEMPLLREEMQMQKVQSDLRYLHAFLN